MDGRMRWWQHTVDLSDQKRPVTKFPAECYKIATVSTRKSKSALYISCVQTGLTMYCTQWCNSTCTWYYRCTSQILFWLEKCRPRGFANSLTVSRVNTVTTVVKHTVHVLWNSTGSLYPEFSMHWRCVVS